MSNSNSRSDNEIIKGLLTDSGVRNALNLPATCEDLELTLEPLSTTVMNMSFFDKLKLDSEIITEEGGMVRGCMDEEFDGLNVQDKLREMLLNPESENSDLFSEAEKNEFLFHILKLVCRGGSLMQAESHFANWKDMTKKLYKDFITVNRGEGGAIEITSKVFKVSGGGLFKLESRHNDLFVVIDGAPTNNLISVIKKDYKPFW